MARIGLTSAGRERSWSAEGARVHYGLPGTGCRRASCEAVGEQGVAGCGWLIGADDARALA